MAGLDETKKPNPLQSDQAAAGTDTGSNKPAPGISALDAFSGTPQSNQFGLGAVGSGRLAGPASAADMSALGFAKAGGQQIVDFVAKDKKLETGIAAVDLVGNTGLGFINTTLKMNSAAVELIAVPSKLSTTVEGLKHLPSALPGMLAETGNNLWNGDWATKGQTLGNTAAFVTLTFGAVGGPKSGAAVEGTAARSTSWLSRAGSGLKNWWQGADEVAAASADDLLASAMKAPRGGSVVELPGGATRPLATDLPIPVVREPVVPKIGEPGYVPKVGEPGYVAPKVGEPGYVEPTTPVGPATRLHGPAGEGPVVNVPNRGLGTLPENAVVAPLQDAAATTASTVVRDIGEVAPRMSRLGDDLGTLGLKGEEVAALQRQITAFAKGEVESGAVEAAVQGLRSKVGSSMAGKFDEIVNNAVKDVGDFRAAQIAAKTNPAGVDALVGTTGTRVTGGSVVDEAAVAGATQDVATTISRVEQAAAKAPATEVNALKTTIDDFAKGTATAEKLDQAVTAVRRTLSGDDLAAFDTQMANARRAAEAAQQARGIASVRPVEVAPVEVAPPLKPVETATVKVTETSTEAATALRNVESTAAKAGEAEVAALRNTFEDVVNGKAGLNKLDEAAAAVKAKLPTNDVAAFEAEMAKARQAAQTAQEARGALQTLDNAAPAVAKPFKVADVAPTPVETATVNVSRTTTEATTSLRNVESAAAKAGETEVAALRNTFEDVVNGKASLNKLDEAAAAVKAKLPTNDVAAFEAEMAKARQAAQAAQEARGALQSLDNAAPAVSKPFRLADEPVVPRDTAPVVREPAVKEPVVKEPSATPAEATSRAQTSIREAEDVVKKSLGEADAVKLRTEFDNMMSGKPNKFAETVEDIQARLRAASKADDLAAVTRNTENAAAEAARARTLAGEPVVAPPKVTEAGPPKVTEAGPPKGTTGDGVVPPKEAPTPVQAKQSFTDSAGSLKDDLAGVTSRTSTKAQQALDKFADLTNPTVKDVAALERALGKVSDVSPEIAAKVQQALADARTVAAATAVERAAALTRATEEAAAVTSAITPKGGTAATTDAAAATNVAGKTTDAAAGTGAKLAQAEANLAKAWENFHNTTVPALVQALKAPLERMGLTGEELATKLSSIKQIEELARKAGSADVTGGLATKWADTQFMGALKNRLEMYRASISGSATAGELDVIDRAIASLQNSQRALSGARSGVLSDMTWLQQIGRSFSDHPFYNAWRTSFLINAPLRILYDAGKYHQDQEAAKDAKNGTTNGGAAAAAIVGAGAGATVGVKPGDAKAGNGNDGQQGVQPANQGTGEKKVEVLPRQTGDGTVERTSMTLPGTSDQLKTTQISHSGEPTIVAGGPFRVNAAEPLDNYSQMILRNAQRFGLSTPFAPRGYVAPPVEEARVVMPFANRAKFAGIESGSADFAKTSYTPFVAAGKSLLSLDAVRVMSANPAMALGTDSKGRTLLTPTSTDPISALNARGLVFATAGLGGEGKLIDSKQREAMRKVNTDRRTRGGGAVAGQQGIQFTAVAAPPGAQLTTGTGTNDPSNNDEDNNGVAQTTTVAQTNKGADPDDSGINLTTV